MNTINTTYKRIITRVLSGEASAAEKERLDLWLARSEEHRRVYEQYKRIWELEPETRVDDEFNTQQALHNVLQTIEVAEKAAKHGIQSERRFFISSPQKQYWPYSIAAAFLILITTSLFFFLRSPQAEMLALVAEQGDAIFTLDDGSQVHLRTGASLHYPQAFTDKKRDVKLDGNAFFEVEKDERRPFVITTEHAIIEVLGTSFFIETKDDRMSVYVSEGRVRLQSIQRKGTEVIISKGESGTLVYDQQQIVVSRLENMNFLAWRTGSLVFQDEPLSKVFSALAETYKINVIAPEEVMRLQLTGRFQDETPENILKSIGLVFGLDVAKTNNEYIVRPVNEGTNHNDPEQP